MTKDKIITTAEEPSEEVQEDEKSKGELPSEGFVSKADYDALVAQIDDLKSQVLQPVAPEEKVKAEKHTNNKRTMFTIKKANNGEDPHCHHIACVSFVYSYYLNP
jgi:hypothetical protein